MALVKDKLEASLLQVFTKWRNETDANDARLAQDLAAAIHSYVSAAQVAPGIPVSTAGSPTAQTGATTGIGTII